VTTSTDVRTATILAAAVSNTGSAAPSKTSNAAGRADADMKSIAALVAIGVVGVIAL